MTNSRQFSDNSRSGFGIFLCGCVTTGSFYWIMLYCTYCFRNNLSTSSAYATFLDSGCVQPMQLMLFLTVVVYNHCNYCFSGKWWCTTIATIAFLESGCVHCTTIATIAFLDSGCVQPLQPLLFLTVVVYSHCNHCFS